MFKKVNLSRIKIELKDSYFESLRKININLVATFENFKVEFIELMVGIHSMTEINSFENMRLDEDDYVYGK